MPESQSKTAYVGDESMPENMEVKKKKLNKGFQEEGESRIMRMEVFFFSFFLKLERVCRVCPPG